MSNKEDFFHREERRDTTFSDFLKIMRLHGRKFLLALFLGGLVGLAASFLAPREWEATAVLQIGQIYDGTSITLLEPPTRAIERFRSRAFLDQVIAKNSTAREPEDDPEIQLFLRSASVKLVRSSDLIELQVRGYSMEAAQRSLRTLIGSVLTTHEQVIAPTIKRMQISANEVSTLLSEATALQSQLDIAGQRAVSNRKANQGAKSDTTDILLTQLISTNSENLRRLQIRKGELEEQLSPQRTFNTRVLGDIVVPTKPAYPRRAVAGVIGALGGLFLLIVWLLWRGALSDDRL